MVFFMFVEEVWSQSSKWYQTWDDQLLYSRENGVRWAVILYRKSMGSVLVVWIHIFQTRNLPYGLWKQYEISCDTKISKKKWKKKLENRIGFYLRIGFPQSFMYLHVIKIFQTFFYLAQRKKKEKLFLKIMFILIYLHVNFSHIFSIELRFHSTYSVFNLERYVNEYKMCVLSRRRKRYKNVERTRNHSH